MRWYRTNMKWRYRLSDEDLDFLLTDARCQICGKDGGERKLVVDHCHRGKHVRGILCGKCNSGLGFFEDDILSLHNAITYLMESSK